MANKFKVFGVAKFFLNKEPFMTHKKLQKLVYYGYVWYLVKNNNDKNELKNRLFDDRIEAWVHGPVCRILYDNYLGISNCNVQELEQEEIVILNKVWQIYGKYTGAELENLTHKEEPWKIARGALKPEERCNFTIKDEDIYEYYSRKIN